MNKSNRSAVRPRLPRRNHDCRRFIIGLLPRWRFPRSKVRPRRTRPSSTTPALRRHGTEVLENGLSVNPGETLIGAIRYVKALNLVANETYPTVPGRHHHDRVAGRADPSRSPRCSGSRPDGRLFFWGAWRAGHVPRVALNSAAVARPARFFAAFSPAAPPPARLHARGAPSARAASAWRDRPAELEHRLVLLRHVALRDRRSFLRGA